MNEQEAIFVPIEYDNYKKNKIALLKMRLLDKNVIKKLEDIKETFSEKNQVRKLLEKSLSELKREFARFEKELPEIKEKEEKKIVAPRKFPTETKFTKIDLELRQIQEKLNSLRNE